MATRPDAGAGWRSDLPWVALVLAILLVAAAAYRPLDSTGGMAGPGAAGPGAEPVPTDWIGPFSARIGLAARPAPEVRVTVEAGLNDYALVGLVESEGAQWALIDHNGISQTLQIGDILDGYELVQIRSDRVVFVRDGEDATLWLSP